MKFRLPIFFLLASVLTVSPLAAQTQRCSSNDTIVGVNEDQNNLMNYLKGTWAVSGSWTITEGAGKVKRQAKAKVTGVDTYTPILNGHFLQKQTAVRLKYNSKTLEKPVQESFSSMTVLTFNSITKSFYHWYYDCAGHFAEYNGAFEQDQNQYIFNSKMVDDENKSIEVVYTLQILDDDHYRSEIKKRSDGGSNWQVVFTSTAARKN